MVVRSQIDVGLARRLVETQFPQWSGLPLTEVELDGWDNRTFRLGEELLVRLPTGDWYARQVDKEQRWLPVLGPQLPLPIPQPVARGAPDAGFPYAWSVYRWLEGAPVATAGVADRVRLATDLARFLRALRQADAAGGPPPGEHNFFRGGPLATYTDETVAAIDKLGDEIPRGAVERVWEEALSTTWTRDPVWVHGDVAAGNLLVRDGRLAAVIDFGSSAVGDPACDTVIAWTFFTAESRDRFRSELGLDDATWSRGRGWALWKSLISLTGNLDEGAGDAAAANRREIAELVAGVTAGTS